MSTSCYTIRNAAPQEFKRIGELMVAVYSQLDGFPTETEQPAYYKMLSNVGLMANNPNVELIVAANEHGHIAGAVVYFGEMRHYGSGGTATSIRNASGFRLLAVDQTARGNGIGKMLTMECLRKARDAANDQVIIHSTKAMQTAWNMYEAIGFKRSEDLDFLQGDLPVYGFRLHL